MVDSFFGRASAEAGGEAHGLFNIPILYSPGGQAISSINSKDNRNYPCMAAKLPWSSGNHHLYSRDAEENDEKWTDNDPDTMFQFMNATGLYQSDDWWKYCTDTDDHHGNHCEGNKNIDWKGKFGPNQFKKIQHPFKHCKARKGHKGGFVGCEKPHNNGYDENKPKKCGGKQMMAGGLVASDTRWLNETVLEADDVGEDEVADEGDLSDMTDGDEAGDEVGGQHG